MTLSTVQNPDFGLKSVIKTDGQVYAQPLYAPGVIVNNTHMDLLVIATMNSSLYVFNAGKVWYEFCSTSIHNILL